MTQVRAGWFSPQALLLITLMIHGESYGLKLQDRIRVASGGRILLSTASIYPALNRMVKAGLATSHTDKPRKGGGRPRVIYTLTPKGREHALEIRQTAQGVLGLP